MSIECNIRPVKTMSIYSLLHNKCLWFWNSIKTKKKPIKCAELWRKLLKSKWCLRVITICLPTIRSDDETIPQIAKYFFQMKCKISTVKGGYKSNKNLRLQCNLSWQMRRSTQKAKFEADNLRTWAMNMIDKMIRCRKLDTKCGATADGCLNWSIQARRYWKNDLCRPSMSYRTWMKCSV